MRSASPRWAKVTIDAVPRLDERAEVALGLGQPARGDRGPLRLERVRLAGRKLVELDDAGQARARPPSSSRHTRGRPRAARRDRPRRAAPTRCSGSSSPGLGGRAAARRPGWIDGVVERMQRALGERPRRPAATRSRPRRTRRAPARARSTGRRRRCRRARRTGRAPRRARPARSRRARAARRARRRPARPRRRAGSAPAARSPAAARRRSRAPTRRRARRPRCTSSARDRSPTRCAGGSRPVSRRTPREASSPTFSSPRNQPAASAASRASRRRRRGRRAALSRAIQGAARTSGSSGSETRADAGPLHERAKTLALGEFLRQRREERVGPWRQAERPVPPVSIVRGASRPRSAGNGRKSPR